MLRNIPQGLGLDDESSGNGIQHLAHGMRGACRGQGNLWQLSALCALVERLEIKHQQQELK
jgi:hypothetical protein